MYTSGWNRNLSNAGRDQFSSLGEGRNLLSAWELNKTDNVHIQPHGGALACCLFFLGYPKPLAIAVVKSSAWQFNVVGVSKTYLSVPVQRRMLYPFSVTCAFSRHIFIVVDLDSVPGRKGIFFLLSKEPSSSLESIRPSNQSVPGFFPMGNIVGAWSSPLTSN